MVWAQAVWQMQPWHRWGWDIRLKSPLKRHANTLTQRQTPRHTFTKNFLLWSRLLTSRSADEHLSRSYPKTPCSSLSPSLTHSLSPSPPSVSIAIWMAVPVKTHDMGGFASNLFKVKRRGKEGRGSSSLLLTLRFALIVHLLPVTLTVTDLGCGEGVLSGDDLGFVNLKLCYSN